MGPLNDWLTRFASTPASSLADGRLRAYAVYLLARQGIKPNAALSNVEQELTRRYPQAWPTDLAAAYLASTYRLMQRNDDADRIIRNVPWSPQKRDLGEETYYDPVVHDAQLLYLLARHFPDRLGAAPPVALETISAAVSGNRAIRCRRRTRCSRWTRSRKWRWEPSSSASRKSARTAASAC